MEIRCPSTPIEFALRNRLLQQTLRSSDDLWPIQDEYPTVLHPRFASNSFCLFDDSANILAHANLLNSVLESRDGQRQIKVGCVGNVATDIKSQGLGLQKKIFAAIESTALKRGLQGLFLWSDLRDFFGKLGFSPLGEECRWFLSGPIQAQPSQSLYSVLVPVSLSEAVLSQLLRLRNHSCESQFLIKRDYADFERLLTIPGMQLFIGTRGSVPDVHKMGKNPSKIIRSLEPASIESWYLMGKGADMKGVIHEWGVSSTQRFSDDLSAIQREVKHFMLLAPMTTKQDLVSVLRRCSTDREEHSMALYKNLSKNSVTDWHHDYFLWGLDSI